MRHTASCFVLSILFVATSLISCSSPGREADPPVEKSPILTGADQLFNEPYHSWIRGKKIGLITNQTGVDSELRGLPDLLAERDDIELVALFAPEHGLYGEAQAGEEISDKTNIYSLYGETNSPTPKMLEGIEVLIYDIQDVGARFYTYISTMYECMESISGTEIIFLVLDRPNPIGGTKVEGPVLEEGYESFVGIHTIPNRYGMTAGELAQLLKAEKSLSLDLRVARVQGWNRVRDFSDYGKQWINPSPNMPGFEAALSYPGFCLVEGTSISEGRGTTRPFELFGAPWIKAPELAAELNSLDLPGVKFRPQRFTPTFSKYQGESCNGVQLHITDNQAFQPVTAALYFISTVKRLHPEEFSFRDDSFDRLCGNSWVREMLLENRKIEAIKERWEPRLEEFKGRRALHLIY